MTSRDLAKGHQVMLARPGQQQNLECKVSMVPGGPNGAGRGSSSGNNESDLQSPTEPAPLRKFRRRKSPIPDCAG